MHHVSPCIDSSEAAPQTAEKQATVAHFAARALLSGNRQDYLIIDDWVI
jgi:hypothetical protein